MNMFLAGLGFETDNVLDWVASIIGQILFGLIVPTMSLLITSLGMIFKAFAGIESVYTVDKPEGAIDNDGGLVYDLLNTALIRKLIMSIMILAAFLLIIFTVMAFLKNVYAQKQKTAKEIISNSLKGVLYFIFVPVCTLLGVYLGNIVLKAVDGVTSPTGSSGDLGRRLFVTCAYNANYFRDPKDNSELIGRLQKDAETWNYHRKDEIVTGLTAEEYAYFVDDMFATTMMPIEAIGTARYYHVSQFDFLTYIIGGCFMLYVLASLAFAMVRRIFIILIWFVISPACCAMFPIDEGKMVGKYKDEMTKQVLSAYGAVAGVNLFYSIMPLIDQINFYGGNPLSADWFGIIELFILVSGLLCVKEIVSSLSSLVGGDDALAKGSSLMKSTTGAMKKYAGGAVKGISKFSGKIASDVSNAGKKGFWKNVGVGSLSALKHGTLDLGKSATKGLLGIDIDETKKAYKDSKKDQDEKNAKKALKEFTKELENGKGQMEKGFKSFEEIFKQGAQGMSEFIKEFTMRGGSKEDAVKKLSEMSQEHADKPMTELEINQKLAKFEKEKAIFDVATSQNMPGILNAKAELDVANANMGKALNQLSGFGNIDHNAKEGTKRYDALESYNKAVSAAKAGQFAEAASILKGINPSDFGDFDEKKGVKYKDLLDIVSSSSSVDAETAMRDALTKMEGLFNGAAGTVEKIVGGNKANIEDAAKTIKDAANDFRTVGGVIDKAMSTLNTNLTKVTEKKKSTP